MQLKSKFAAVASAAMLTVGLAVAFAGPAAAREGTVSVAAPRATVGRAFISGFFMLVNFKSGKCLGIHNGSTNDGYAQQQDCAFDSDGSQVWSYTGSIQHGEWQRLQNDASQTFHACLSVQNGSASVNAQLTGYTCKSFLTGRISTGMMRISRA